MAIKIRMVVFCVATEFVIWIKHKRTRDISTVMVNYYGSLWVFLHGVYIWQKCNLVHFIAYRLNFSNEVFITSQFSNHIFLHTIPFATSL